MVARSDRRDGPGGPCAASVTCSDRTESIADRDAAQDQRTQWWPNAWRGEVTEAGRAGLTAGA